MNKEQAAAILSKGNKLEIVYRVEVNIKGTDNPFYGVTEKISTIRAEVKSYQQEVSEKSGTEFKAQKRKWGTYTEVPGIIEHKDTHYLSVIVKENVETKYYVNCKEVPLEILVPYMKDSYTSKSQKAVGLTEDKQVIAVSIKLNNILALSVIE